MTPIEKFKQLMLFHCLDAPSWANYAVVESNGSLWLMEHKTKLLAHGWAAYNENVFIKTEFIIKLDVTGIDWRETLIELN